MPNSQRTQMKADAQRAVDALEKAAMYLLRLRALYDPNYPEYVQAIDALLTVTSDLRDKFVEFAKVI